MTSMEKNFIRQRTIVYFICRRNILCLGNDIPSLASDSECEGLSGIPKMGSAGYANNKSTAEIKKHLIRAVTLL